MQTKITAEMPFPIPGTHGNGQPFRADAYPVASGNGDAVTFGNPVQLVDGAVKNMTATNQKYIGMAVGPEQHIRWVLPDAEPSITITSTDSGEVGVAARGTWAAIVHKTKTTTEPSVTGDTVSVGDKVALAVVGGVVVYKKAGSNDTAVATVVQVGAEDGEDQTKLDRVPALIRLGE